MRLLQQLCLQELIPEELQTQFLTTLSKETRNQYPKKAVEIGTPEDDEVQGVGVGGSRERRGPRGKLFQGRKEETKTID